MAEPSPQVNRRSRRLVALSMLALVAMPELLSTPSRAQVGGLPATVVDYRSALPLEEEWPVQNAAGKVLGNARWRTVAGTGNCCENYVMTTPRGRLMDMGGNYIRYTDDHGLTWKEVRSRTNLLGAEGALSPAPGEDVVGVTWDPYSGDRILAFKYDGEEESWTYMENGLHTPFFDRPWFAVIDGPFKLGPIEVPYITILKGGWPSKDIAYISYDGINYVQVSQRESGHVAGTVSKWLDVEPDPMLDWMQPLTKTGITPLGKLGALWTAQDFLGVALEDEPHGIMERPDTMWKNFTFPQAPHTIDGRMLVDSKGRLHVVSPNFEDGEARSFTYSISSNGGRAWTSEHFDLPPKHRFEDWDFKANANLGMAAVAIHSHRVEEDAADEADQDLVFELDIRTDSARLKKLYWVGLGDLNVGVGVTSTNGRFDFATVTIMPDKTIVTSFVDSEHRNPALAILLR